jgi:hypothetical protein
MLQVGFPANYICTEYASLASNSDDEKEINNFKKLIQGKLKRPTYLCPTVENDKTHHA